MFVISTNVIEFLLTTLEHQEGTRPSAEPSMERQAEGTGPWPPGSRTGRGGQEARPTDTGTRKLLPAFLKARSRRVAREPSAQGLEWCAKGKVVPITVPGVIQASSSPLRCRKWAW